MAAGAPQTGRRHRRRRGKAARLSTLLCAIAVVAVLVAYVAAYARATRHSYQHARLRTRLHRLQVEHKLLEARVADLQRMDRIIHEAKLRGMQPREALQFVALTPKQPPVREFRQASARP